MIGGLFLIGVTPDAPTQAGMTVGNGIAQGAATGQLTIGDQHQILLAAANTPGGAALNRKQLMAAAAIALVVGAGVGYLVASSSTRKCKRRLSLSDKLLGWGESKSGRN